MAERLVLVHGFTQTGVSWLPFERALRNRIGDDVDITALDAPGHGRLGDVHLDLVEGARLLGQHGGRATYIGYSMGGRLCLHLALERPDLVNRLVLIGTTPGIEDEAERSQRRAADDVLATRLEQIGLEEFLHEWLAQPLFANLDAASAGHEARLANTVSGLAASLRLAGTGVQAPLWDRLHELAIPVLVIAGEHDTKFAALGRRMASLFPDATFDTIADAGHSVHLEQPDASARVIGAWLATTQPPRANPNANTAP